jgi:nuclear protein localization family protein 4
MQGEPLTVRLVSKDGTERYEMQPNETLQDLKKKVQQKTLIPVANQTLSLDRAGKEVLSSGANTLTSLGIRHGQMVFLSYTGERPINNDEDPKKLRNIKKKWDLKSLMEHLDSQGLVFKAQETTHCKVASLDFASCDKFQQYPREFAFLKRREGYLYGKYLEDGNVTAEYIYEPPQEHSSSGTILLDDPAEEKLVDTIANALGVQKVGWIFTVPPNDERDYIMSSHEVVRAAQQNAEAIKKYGDAGKSFIAVKVSTDEEGQVHFEPFQVTDQAVKLVQNDLLKPPKDPKVVVAKQEVAMARQGAGRKDSPELDPDVLIKPVAVVNHEGPLSCVFEIENRPEHPQNMAALKRHLLQFKGKPFLLAVTDFHFIRYLGKEFLSPETDIPALCEAVKTGDSDALEGFKLLIDSIAGF